MKRCEFNLYRKFRDTVLWVVVCGGSSFACHLSADEITNIALHRINHWERASDSELDQLRGGFVLLNGVQIDFSLERITSLNGAVVSSIFFQIPDTDSLLQNGSLNQSLDFGGSGLNSVIQNNLDNQFIRTVTELNIAVSQFKNLDLDNGNVVFSNAILPNAR